MKKLPKSLKEYFWDVDTYKLDPEERSLFVIQRLLDKGNDKAIHWVRKNYSNQQLRDTLVRLRDFNPKIANFWSLFLDIPKEKIPCLQTPYLQRRRIHWPY